MMLAADGLPMTNFRVPLKVEDWWSSLKATASLETLESMYAMYEEFPKKIIWISEYDAIHFPWWSKSWFEYTCWEICQKNLCKEI